MSSSPEPRQRVVDASAVTATLPSPELRTGMWTRLGGSRVLGDTVTEHTLVGLVDEARTAAQAQGFSTGWAEGRRAAQLEADVAEARRAEAHRQAEARRDAEHRAALARLADTAAALHDAFTATCSRVEDSTLEIAVRLTEELLGRELAVAENPGLDAVRRALDLSAGDALVCVRVHPDTAADPQVRERVASAGDAAVVVPDPTLGRGDAFVETRQGVVDARLAAALDRVREVLLP